MNKLALFVLGAVLGGAGAWWWAFQGTSRSGNPASIDADAPSVALTHSHGSAGDRIIGMGTVDVESGITPLALPIAGTITGIDAREGQRVSKGHPLIHLDDRRAKAQLTKAEIAVREAEMRLALTKKAQQQHELAQRQQEWAIAAARTAKSAAERNLASIRELAVSETLPEARIKDAQDRCDSLSSALRVEELKLEKLQLQDPLSEIRLAQSSIDAAMADRDCARQLVADHALIAPREGTILRILVNEGQLVGPNSGQAAIWFAPIQPTIIRAEVDQAYSGVLAVGMQAEFFDDNRRLSLGRGRIARISSWIAQRRSQLDEPFQRNDVRTMECIVEIDQSTRDLRFGERVRVDFAAGSAAPTQPNLERLARNR